MTQRGRKSIENLMVIEGGLAAEAPRPKAPPTLDQNEAKLWKAIVDCMPPEHFILANDYLLKCLCHHVGEVPYINRLIGVYKNKKGDIPTKIYTELLHAREGNDLSIIRLSRAMRLTQLANKKLPKQVRGSKPWEDDD
jgi:hypothetical protein